MSARLCVLGPSGRMGKMVLELAAGRDDLSVVAAVDHPDSPAVGSEALPGVVVTGDIDEGLSSADVYIDFTSPESTATAASAAADRGVAAVIGTTGLGEEATSALEALSWRAPVLTAPNFSLGVNLLLALAERAAAALGPDYDLEVVEAHHRRKRDAPSGTALALARAMAAGRGLPDEAIRTQRSGDVGPRPDAEIGVASVRGGDVVGEHTALFVGELDRLEITHRAGSRKLFAAGALRAAAWLAGQPAGRYQMADLLGLS